MHAAQLWIALCLLGTSKSELVASGPFLVRDGLRVSLQCDGRPGSNCVVYRSSLHHVWHGRNDSGVRILVWDEPTQTRRWVETLDNLTRMHRFDIVDVGEPQPHSSWGVNTDFARDWMAATTVVAFRLHLANPDTVISVGAFCHLDLRQMMFRVGPGDAYERGKLIYSVRLRTSVFWWDGPWLLPLSLASIVICFISALTGCHRWSLRYSAYGALGNTTRRDEMHMALSTSVFYSTLVSLTLVVLVSVIECNTEYLLWTLVVTVVFLAFGSLYNRALDVDSRLFMPMVSFWTSLYFLTVSVVTMYLLTPQAYEDALDVMSLQDRPVPVWVADATPLTNPVSQLMWNYAVRDFGLDHA